jgi:hypothetical protein
LSRLVFARWRYDHDCGASVYFIDHYVDASAWLDLNGFANYISANWKLASAAIYENRERDSRWSSEVGKLIECSTHCASSKENVIDDHDLRAFDVAWKTRFSDDRPRADGLEIVAIECDVQRPLGDLDSFTFFDERNDATGQLYSAALNSDDDEVGRAVVQLDDLVRHSLQRPVDRAGREDGFLFSCSSRHRSQI